MLGALYLIGIPMFVLLAWVFSEAVHVREFDDRNSRRLASVLAGALWPVVLIGVAQLVGLRILARLIRARTERSLVLGR